jgi:hypothetical protein
MPYTPEYLELWQSLDFANNDKKRLYSYQSFQGRDRKRQTDELFWRNSNELGIDLSGMGFVIDNSTGELTLVFDGTGDNPVEIFKWLTFTDGTNSIDAASGADVFTFEGLNDATVTVDPTNKKVSIDVVAGGLQNLIETITADGPDSFTASSATDTLAVSGNNGVVTKITGSTLQITGPMSHRTFVGDTGTYSATTANSTFNIVGGTDIDTTVSGNTVTIDFAGLAATSLWTEDTGNGYLYPSTIAHKVGINTATPAEQFTIKGVTQIQPEAEGITIPVSILKFKNTHHTFTKLTSLGGDPANTSDPGYGGFVIENNLTSLFLNDNGGVLTNNTGGGSNSIIASSAFEVHTDYANTAVSTGLVVVTDDTVNSSNVVMLAYNEYTVDPTKPATNSLEYYGDGTLKLSGYRKTNNPLLASLSATVGSPHALMGFSDNGTVVKKLFDSGVDGAVLNTFGEKTITHSLGAVPSVVIAVKQFEDGAPIHAQTTGETCEVLRGSFTTTTFDVRLNDNFGTPLSNLFRTVYYIVLA